MRYQIALVLILVGILFVPGYFRQQYNTPHGNTKYIRRVYSGHTVGQVFESKNKLHAIDVLARGNDFYTGILIVLDSDKKELGRRQLSLTPEDQWYRIKLNSALEPAKEAKFILGTVAGVEKDEAILVRYQPDSENYPEGVMTVDGEASPYGDLGFRLYERASNIRGWFIWGQSNSQSIEEGKKMVFWGGLIGLISWILEKLSQSKKYGQVYLILSLVMLALVAMAIRLPYLQSIEGVWGGDAFNYLSKARALLVGKDPFVADVRKGPLFSLLLVPGFFLPYPLLWARMIGILSAVTGVILTTVIARQFKLNWGIAFGAGVLLAVNQHFIWEAPSGLANTLFVALILAAISTYLVKNNFRAQMAMVVLSGLVFLTRYEGIIVAVVLLLALWWREKLNLKRGLFLTAIMILIMAIPQVSLMWSGKSGVRGADDLLNDGGLSIATNQEQLLENIEKFREFLSLTWALPPDVLINSNIMELVIAGIISGILVKKDKIGFWWIMSVAGVVAWALLLFTKSSEARDYLAGVPWFLIGVGIWPWIKRRKFDGAVLVVLLAIFTVAITLILPKDRYYLPLIPFLAVLMASGAGSLIKPKILVLIFLGLASSFFYFDGQDVIAINQERYNVRAHKVNMMIEAVTYLRGQHGRVGFRTGDEQAIMTLLDKNRRDFYNEEDTLESEIIWIKKKDVKYLVERNDNLLWKSAREHSDIFEKIHTFENIHGNDRVIIYLVHRKYLFD